MFVYEFLFSESGRLVSPMPGVDFNQIRANISIGQVLDLLSFVPAIRRGDQVRGPCPIHRSNSAESCSFSAKLGRDAFRCFTCGAHGNQLDLWSKAQSLSTFDAALDLCHRLDIAVPTLGRVIANREEESVQHDTTKRGG
jgi:DNA primase